MLSKYIPKDIKLIHAYIDYSGSAKKDGIRDAVEQVITTANNMDIPVAITVMDTGFHDTKSLETPKKYYEIHKFVHDIMDKIGYPNGPFDLQTLFRHINQDGHECNIFVSDMILNVFPDKDNPGKFHVLTNDNSPECLPKNPDSIWYLPINTFKGEKTAMECFNYLKQYMLQNGIDISTHILPTIEA